MLSPLGAHAICAALSTADYLARGWRIRLLAGGLGYRLRFRDAMAVNLIGDAACSLTPLRIAGEPARLGMMSSAGVPPTATLVAITYEVLAAWPVIMTCAGVLLWRYAPEWWASASPGLIRSVHEAWPWVVAVALISLAVWVWVRRSAPAPGHRWRRPIKRMIVHWRRMPWPLLLATAPLTFINLAARVAVLPVLAATLPHAPPPGLVWVGSLALLYSQLVLPTPSGAGAVELGFLSGAAGDLGSGEAALLVVWRFYTTGIGLVLGALLAVHRVGWGALHGWIGVRSTEQPYRRGAEDAKERGEEQ